MDVYEVTDPAQRALIETESDKSFPSIIRFVQTGDSKWVTSKEVLTDPAFASLPVLTSKLTTFGKDIVYVKPVDPIGITPVVDEEAKPVGP